MVKVWHLLRFGTFQKCHMWITPRCAPATRKSPPSVVSGLNRPANPLKFDLAACAKKNGLDAIHDTVHEMARDEARHGRGLEGLLKRYFK